MTLLYIQGWEGFPSAADRTTFDVAFDFHDTVSSSEAAIVTGRVGGRAGWIDNANNVVSSFRLPVAGLSAEDDWIVGFAFRTTYNYYQQVTGNNNPAIQFIDPLGTAMLSIIPISGTLIARSGGGTGTVLGIGSVSITTYVWHYLEVKVKFHNSTGTLDVRLNEEDVTGLTGLTGIDTNGSSSYTRPSMIYFGPAGNDTNSEIDDIYICDDQGSQHTDFLGDNAVRQLLPDGVGNSEQFTSSAVGDNYTFVDETDPDGDTTYVESSTATEKDTYTFGDISDTPAAFEGVAVNSYVKKTDAGTRNFVHVARSSTTESDSSVIYPSATTYRYMQSIYPQDPNTSAAWDKAGINAAEFGFKVNA